jgi:hypothetical protein
VNLLTRATALHEAGGQPRLDLLVDLRAALFPLGEGPRALAVLDEALEAARAVAESALEWRARLERNYVIGQLEPGSLYQQAPSVARTLASPLRRPARVLGDVVESPVDAPSDARLLRERARLLLVGGRELQILRPCRARLQELELDLDLADASADLEDGGALDVALPQEIRHLPRGLSSPRFRYFLAKFRANRLLKKRS